MKRFFTIFLVFILLLGLTACGKEASVETTTTAPTTQPTTEPTTQPTTEPTTEPTMANDKYDPVLCFDLEGIWQYELVLDGSLLHMTDLEGRWVIPMTYVFLDNGAYTIATGDVDTVLTAFEEAVENYMFENYHTQFIGDSKLQGMKDAQIEEAWQTQQEVARVDAENFVKNLSLAPRIAMLDRSGDYYVEDGKAYLSKSDGTYEVCGFQRGEDGILTLTDTDNPNLYRPLGIDFPMALNPFSFIEPRN